MIQKNTTKFAVSGVVMDYIDDSYVCRDCLVSTEDADNPDIGCKRRKVSDAKMFLNKSLDKNAYPNGKLPCIPPEYDGVSQSNGKYATANEWCRVISHNPIMPALITHFFGGDLKGLFGAIPFEVLHQLLLGIFKYILQSVYNYRTIPEE